MFCSNCGKQIPDNVKFCNDCGAPQQISEAAHNADTAAPGQDAPQTTTPAPQKKSSGFKSILIMLAVFLGVFLIARSCSSDSGSVRAPAQPSNREAYQKVLSDAGISHRENFGTLETCHYVMVDENGFVTCHDYGYKKDVVKEMIQTIYIPIDGLSAVDISNLKAAVQSELMPYDLLACCTVTYSTTASHFKASVVCSNLDKEENYSALYRAGITEKDTFISMYATDEDLVKQGFIKK